MPTPPNPSTPPQTEQSPGALDDADSREAGSRPGQAARHAAANAFATEVARLCHDLHCTEVIVLDVRGLSQVTDFLVIASGTSDRQMQSVLDHAIEIGEQSDFAAIRTNIDTRSVWLVADFVDVMLHLFEPQTRAHYDLEMLWGDAPRVEWERPQERSRNLAGLSPDDVLPGD